MSNIFQNIAPPSWVPQLRPTGCFFATGILWRIVGDRSRGRHGGLVPENQRTVWLPEGTMCLFSLFTFLVEGILRELVFRIFECFVRECLPWDYFSPFTFFVEGILPLARRKKSDIRFQCFTVLHIILFFRPKPKTWQDVYKNVLFPNPLAPCPKRASESPPRGTSRAVAESGFFANLIGSTCDRGCPI